MARPKMIMKSYGLGVLFFRSFEEPINVELAAANSGSRLLETIISPDSTTMFAMASEAHELSPLEANMAEDEDFLSLLHGVRRSGSDAFRERFIQLIEGYMWLGRPRL